MTKVRIPPTLRNEVGGERQVEASGDTVRELLHDLSDRYPALGAQILDDGDTLDGLDTAVAAGQTLILLPAMAGGG